MAACAVVAEMKADRTTLITMKLKRIPVEFLPKRMTNHKAKRLATRVFTSILANTKDNIFNHITG